MTCDDFNVRPPFDSAQVVPITPITVVYGTKITNYIVTGAYKPTYNWGASHCYLLKQIQELDFKDAKKA